MSGEIASGRWGKSEARPGNQAEHEIIDDRHDMSCGTFGEAGLVFMQSNIAGVMEAVLNPPVRAQGGEEFGGRGQLCR